MPRPFQRDEYTIGWICALPVELAAALEMMDEDPGVAERYDNDDNLYYLGLVAGHSVIVVSLPAGRIGNNPAATVATQMRATFPGIRFGLMVGIGGGVPSPEADIRLGDVVVSQPDKTFPGVVQYDSGKATLSGFQRTGSLDGPPPLLLATIASVRANELRGRSKISENLLNLPPRFQRDKAGPDILYDAAYDHPGGLTCAKCNSNQQTLRQLRERDEIAVHYGTIASGNQVIKSATERDRVSAELGGVLCFEMEAAGLMNRFPCLVIRGICDYSDSHKNRKWQPYAAAVAAAYAKEILSTLPSKEVAKTRTVEEVVRDPSAVEYRQYVNHRVPNHEQSHASELPNLSRTVNTHSSSESDRTIVVAGCPLSARVGSPAFKQDLSLLSDDQRNQLIASLQFKQMDARLLTLQVAQAKTCRWMLDNSRYKHWMKGENIDHHRGVFWIKGKPGAGKSIMMKFLFSEIKESMKRCLILSFFFNARGEHLEKSVSGLYRSLLLQLLRRAPEARHILNDYTISNFETIKDTGWRDEILRQLFTSALKRLKHKRVICFVDALDECPEDDVRAMISFFEEFDGLEHAAEFSVCFSSRHYPEISIRSGFQLTLESEREHTNDITLYVDTHLKLDNSSQAEDIKDQILRKSSGIFLWVYLVIPILNKEFDKGRIKALKKRLSEIPAKLHDLFLDMLNRDSKGTKDFLVCVQVILFAARPLRPDEFRIAIESYCDKNQEPEACDSSQMSPENLRKFVLDVSKGLAEITKSEEPTIQFIHESVRDFLLKEGGLKHLQSVEGIPEALGHGTLKEICALRIGSMDYYHGSEESHEESVHSSITRMVRSKKAIKTLLAKKRPLLQYSMEYLFFHANQAQKFGLDQTSFLRSFNTQTWADVNVMIRGKHSVHSKKNHVLYTLAESGCAHLIRIHPERDQHLELQGGRFGYPLAAALYEGHITAARALFDLPLLEDKVSLEMRKAVSRRQPPLKKGGYYKKYHILSILCTFGDPDLLIIVLNSGRFELDKSIACECFNDASSEAIVDILMSYKAHEILYGCGKDDKTEPPLASVLTSTNLHHFESTLRRDLSIIREWKSAYGNLLEYSVNKGFNRMTRLCIGHMDTIARQDAIISEIESKQDWNTRRKIMAYLLEEGLQSNDSFKQRVKVSTCNSICHRHDVELFTLLLDNGLLDIGTENPHSETQLQSSTSTQEGVHMKLFSTLCLGENGWVNYGFRLFMSAVIHDDFKGFCGILRHAHCDPNTQNLDHETALHLCVRHERHRMLVELLARQDVDPNLKNKSKQRALHCCVEYEQSRMLSDFLAQQDDNPNSKMSNGQTALMVATERCDDYCVKELLRSDFTDPDLGSHNHSSPLALAFKFYTIIRIPESSRDYWEISKMLLLTFKVDPDKREGKLLSASEIARHYGANQLLRMLEVFHDCCAARERDPLGPFDQKLKDLEFDEYTF